VTEAAAWRVVSRGILLVIGLLLGGLLARSLQQVIVQLMLAVLLAAALNPLISALTESERARRWRWRPGRGLAAVLVLLTAGVVIVLALGLVARSVSPDLQALAANAPTYAARIQDAFDQVVAQNPELAARVQNGGGLPSVQELLAGGIGVLSQASRVLGLATGVFSGVLYLIFTLILALYLAIDSDKIRRYLVQLMPFEWHPQMLRATERIGQRLGAWSRGQALLAAIIGGMTYVVALVIGLPYAGALALIAALGELVPNIGPILASVPLVAVGFLQSPTQGLLALLAAVMIQQLENNLIVPRVMGRAVDLHPVAVMVAILSGNELLGIPGALMAVPVAASLAVVIDELQQARLAKRLAEADIRGA
jgi:predicted PurR-regulated permease PerM